MVTVADADTEGFASSVAVTATIGGVGAVFGAVYKPVELIEPQAIPAQPLPEMLQFTTPLAPPLEVVVNCIWPDGLTWGELGETVSDGALTMLAVATADADGSATAVALMLTWGGIGAVAGALYRPVEVIDPHELPEQPVPEISHVTALLVDPATDAENCCKAPVATWTDPGEMLTATDCAD